MTVMVDAPVRERAASNGQVGYLLELTAAEPVKTRLYADTGPPADVPRRRVPYYDGDVVDGWLLTKPSQQEHVVGVVHAEGEHVVVNGFWRDDPRLDLVRRAIPPPSYAADDDPVARMRADTIALMTAEAFKADVFVTERDFLLNDQFGFAREVAVLRPDDALPIVGLYLRQHGTFLIQRWPSGVHKYDRMLFYWVAARELLPAGWRWMAACGQHSAATGDDAVAYLAASLFQRVDRALRARDRLLAVLTLPQDNGTADEALVECDQICLWLMGALDVAALVADLALGLNSDQRAVAWQNARWRRRVAVAERGLADLVSYGHQGGFVLTILRELRNSIHGEALQATGLRVDGQAQETLLGIPRSRQQDILDAMKALGGQASWGVQQLLPGELHVLPGELVEQLMSRTVKLIDDLLAATPVERLQRVNLRPDQLSRPTDPDSPFSVRPAQRIRWQLGL